MLYSQIDSSNINLDSYTTSLYQCGVCLTLRLMDDTMPNVCGQCGHSDFEVAACPVANIQVRFMSEQDSLCGTIMNRRPDDGTFTIDTGCDHREVFPWAITHVLSDTSTMSMDQLSAFMSCPQVRAEVAKRQQAARALVDEVNSRITRLAAMWTRGILAPEDYMLKLAEISEDLYDHM